MKFNKWIKGLLKKPDANTSELSISNNSYCPNCSISNLNDYHKSIVGCIIYDKSLGLEIKCNFCNTAYIRKVSVNTAKSLFYRKIKNGG